MFPSKTLAYSDSADDKNDPLCVVMYNVYFPYGVFKG